MISRRLLTAMQHLVLWCLLPMLGLTVISGCTETLSPKRNLAHVGNSIITSEELALRIAVEKVYGKEDIAPETVVVMLINDALDQEVGARVGLRVTTEDLSALSHHAEETSQAPEILEAVKRIFKNHRDAYERLYLAPRVWSAKLHDLHAKDPAIQQGPRARIEQAYARIIAGETLKSAADELGLRFFEVPKNRSEHSDQAPLWELGPVKGELLPPRLREILDGLADGEIYHGLLSDEMGFRIIQRLEIDENGYRFRVVDVPLRPFEEWFRENAANIPVSIPDQAMAAAIARSYPDLWWLPRR